MSSVETVEKIVAMKSLLASLSDRICGLFNRKTHLDAHKLTKWHHACIWLASSVGCTTMALREDGVVAVVGRTDSSLSREELERLGVEEVPEPISRGYLEGYSSSPTWLQLGSEDLSGSKKKSWMRCAEKLKPVGLWSEDTAKLVATVIALPKAADAEKWEVDFGPNHRKTFPVFKSEEELFMKMALDGIETNDCSGEDNEDAQS